MKEIMYKTDGSIFTTPCPYKKKHGSVVKKVGSDECWNCKCFKGLHGSKDINQIYCNYEDQKDQSKK